MWYAIISEDVEDSLTLRHLLAPRTSPRSKNSSLRGACSLQGRTPPQTQMTLAALDLPGAWWSPISRHLAKQEPGPMRTRMSLLVCTAA